MALVGYARVSSAGQSLDIQDTALREAGATKVFAEKMSGRRASDRTELANALDYIREGDTLLITRLDRLARSASDLHRIVEQLAAKGADLRVLQQSGIDTGSSSGRLTRNILAAVAEFEADIRAERQRDGIEAAKARGVYKGGKPRVDRDAIEKALEAGESPTALAKRLGIARASVYRVRDELTKGAQA